MNSKREDTLIRASGNINQALGFLKSDAAPAIGAWSDGAEHSVMVKTQGADLDHLKVAAAMKGYLANQKQVLVFHQQQDGPAALYEFKAKGDLEDVHKKLLKDGVEFHTLVPTKNGIEVYVADLDGSMAQKVKEAANGERVRAQRGVAEFIGTEKQDGTDREQRNNAKQAYKRIIDESRVRNAAGVWQRIHSTYGETLDPTENELIDTFNNQETPYRFENKEDRHKEYVEVKKWFPNLKAGHYTITQPNSPTYNCAGYSFNDNHRWWWPDADNGLNFWPKDIRNENDIASFDDLLIKHSKGEETKDETYEPGFTKLALFEKKNWDGVDKPTHIARLLPHGKWLSKAGGGPAIAHDLSEIVDDKSPFGYGHVAKIYKVPDSEFVKIARMQ